MRLTDPCDVHPLHFCAVAWLHYSQNGRVQQSRWHLITIARKQHPTGRGSVKGATSIPDHDQPPQSPSVTPSTADPPQATRSGLDRQGPAGDVQFGDRIEPIGLADGLGPSSAGGLATDHAVPDAIAEAHVLGGPVDVSFPPEEASSDLQPGQAMLDAQAVQAQVEALIKSNLGSSGSSTSLAGVVAAPTAAAAHPVGGSSGDVSSRIPLSAGSVSSMTAAADGGGESQALSFLTPAVPASSSSIVEGTGASASVAASSSSSSAPPRSAAAHSLEAGQTKAARGQRGRKRSKADVADTRKSQRVHIDDDAAARLLKELEAVTGAATPSSGSSSAGPSCDQPYTPVSQHAHLDATGPSTSPIYSFQNTFAQYQYPQSHHLAFKEVVRASSVEAARYQPSPGGSDAHSDSRDRREMSTGMTREEEERAADALIRDVDEIEAAETEKAAAAALAETDSHASAEDGNRTAAESKAVAAAEQAGATSDGGEAIASDAGGAASLSVVTDLTAAAQAAMGLDDDGNPLPGNEESHRALAEAVKRLSAQHEQAVQQAASAAAAAAAEAAAAAAAAAAAKVSTEGASASPSASSAAVKASPAAGRSERSPATSRGSNPPVKRFQCPKCERAFARAFNLNTHLATHDPDPNRSKPYPCPYPSCKSEGGRSFSRKHDLQRHVASVHEYEPEPGIHGDPGVIPGDTGGLASLGLGTPGKRFRCETCGRAFVRRDACNRHHCIRRRYFRLEDGSVDPEGSASPISDAPAKTALPNGMVTTTILSNPISPPMSPASPAVRAETTNHATPGAVGASGGASRGVSMPSASPPVHPGTTSAGTDAAMRSVKTPPVGASSREPTSKEAAPITSTVGAGAHASPPSSGRPGAPALAATRADQRAASPAGTVQKTAAAADEAARDEGFSEEVQDIGRRLLAQARAQDRELLSHSKSKTKQPNAAGQQPKEASGPLATTAPATTNDAGARSAAGTASEPSGGQTETRGSTAAANDTQSGSPHVVAASTTLTRPPQTGLEANDPSLLPAGSLKLETA